MYGYGYMGFSGFFFMLLWVAVIVVPFWKLWDRTGHSGWLSLLMVIPLVNIVALYVLAFKEWPAVPRSDRGVE